MNTVSNFPKMTLTPAKQGVKVSIIVPVYNGERYLAECLDSVLAQTLKLLGIPIYTVKSTRDGVVKQFPLIQGLLGLFKAKT